MDTVSNRIKQAMTLRRMRQADIAKQTGINKGSLSCYISGKYQPKQNNLYLIAKSLNINEGWLMGYDVPMERQIPPVGNGFAVMSDSIEPYFDCEIFSSEEIDIISKFAQLVKSKEIFPYGEEIILGDIVLKITPYATLLTDDNANV